MSAAAEQPKPVRAVAVTAEYSWVDGRRFAAPTIAADDPSALADLALRVARAAATGKGGVVLLLAADVLAPLGLPETLTDGAEHDQAPDLLRRHGWTTPDRWGHWTRIYQDGLPTVYMVVPAWKGSYDDGLTDHHDLGAVTAVLATYHSVTGSPDAIAPGYAGILSIRSGRAWRARPYWAPRVPKSLDDVFREAERDLAWSSDRPPAGAWEHTYDAYAAHLAAAAAADMAADPLERETRPRFNPRRAGYWQITPPRWEHSSMPSPTHGARAGTERTWVSTPTMCLLHELAGAGEIDPPTIHAGWLADGGRHLRPWAEALRDALGALGTSAEAAMLRDELKATYRQSVGWLAKPNQILHRPDWRHAIVSQGRATIWRRAWQIGTTENRWPARILTDSLSYHHDSPDPLEAAPESLRLGPWALGAFRPTHSDATAVPVPA